MSLLDYDFFQRTKTGGYLILKCYRVKPWFTINLDNHTTLVETWNHNQLQGGNFTTAQFLVCRLVLPPKPNYPLLCSCAHLGFVVCNYFFRGCNKKNQSSWVLAVLTKWPKTDPLSSSLQNVSNGCSHDKAKLLMDQRQGTLAQCELAPVNTT